MAVLVPTGTFVFFAVFIFSGMTVAGAVSATKVLVVLEIILAAAIAGLYLVYRRQLNECMDAADAIEALMSGDDVFSDWEEFIRSPSDDPEVERIRQRCLMLPDFFPPETPDAYCNAQGMQQLESYATRLRSGLGTRAFEVCASRWTSWRKVMKRSSGKRPGPKSASSLVQESTSATDVIAAPVMEPDVTSEADDGLPVETPPDDAVPVETGAPVKKATVGRKARTSKKKTSKKTATTKKPATTKKSAAAKTSTTTKKSATTRKKPKRKRVA